MLILELALGIAFGIALVPLATRILNGLRPSRLTWLVTHPLMWAVWIFVAASLHAIFSSHP